MQYQYQFRLKFSLMESDDEFIYYDWDQFQDDMEQGNLFIIEEILEDYYNGNIAMEDIISTFPSSQMPFLIPGKHDRLIGIYNKLEQEFPGYGERFMCEQIKP